MEDPAFDPWRTTISNQLVQCLSIATACIPYLKPFLDSLESGLLRVDDMRRRGGIIADSYRGSNLVLLNNQGSTRSKIRKFINQKLSFTSRNHEESRELSDIALANRASKSDTALAVDGESNLWDGQSQSSQSRIITETRNWDVHVS